MLPAHRLGEHGDRVRPCVSCGSQQSVFAPLFVLLLSLHFLTPPKHQLSLSASGTGALQRELKQLTNAGFIVRRKIGNQVFYQANTGSPTFSDLKALVAKTVGVVGVLRELLEPVASQVKVAFVFGSMASGDERPESDIDVLIVGSISFGDAVSRLASAQTILGREVNPTVYPVDEFVAKARARNHFLTSVLKTKRLFIIGDEHELSKLGRVRMAKGAPV